MLLTQQRRRHLSCRRVQSPTGYFCIETKVPKNSPKAFPLGYLPFREQNCSCGTFSSRRRCSCPAAAPADQHSKHCVSLGVPRFCVESQLSAAPRELVGNRQDNQRTGGENPKRACAPLCVVLGCGSFKRERGIETPLPLNALLVLFRHGKSTVTSPLRSAEHPKINRQTPI